MHLKERLAAALQRRWGRIALALLVAVGLVSLPGAVDLLRYRGRIYPAVHLNGIPLGGQKLAEAEAELVARFLSTEELTLTGAPGGDRSVPLSRFGVSWDREKTMAAVRRAGSGCPGYPGRLLRLLRRSTLQLEGVLRVEEETLEEALQSLAGELESPPRDASFTVSGAGVIIEAEREGSFLEREAFRERLLGAVLEGRREVPLPLGRTPPGISAAMLAGYGVEQVMVAFSTVVSPTLPDRVQNIRLGAEAINGYLLPPGGIFSFEALIGETTPEKGYREAPVIVGEELRPGLGGGLCQVSSTLYNAALLANLAIVERYNHSLTINYLPLGRDATISIGHADLKFRNNRDHHILIGAELREGLLTFRLFGPSMAERVEIYSSDIVRKEPPVRLEEDALLPAGGRELVKQGQPGYTVKTWRAVYRGGVVISRELLSHDTYRPTTSVYRVGVGPAPAPPAEDAAAAALLWGGYVLPLYVQNITATEPTLGAKTWIRDKRWSAASTASGIPQPN